MFFPAIKKTGGKLKRNILSTFGEKQGCLAWHSTFSGPGLGRDDRICSPEYGEGTWVRKCNIYVTFVLSQAPSQPP